MDPARKIDLGFVADFIEMKEPTDSEIDSQRIAGEIALVLENGSVEYKASMLRLIKSLRTKEDYEAIRDSCGLTDFGTTI